MLYKAVMANLSKCGFLVASDVRTIYANKVICGKFTNTSVETNSQLLKLNVV